MRVVVWMAPSVNGLIAKGRDDVSFVTDTEFRGFLKGMKRAGCDIIGRRTYEEALKGGWFPYQHAFHVVMTSKRIRSRWANVLFTGGSPKQVIGLLERRGFKEVLVGGGRLAGAFMEEGLVDELIIDVEPSAFGRGVALFGDSDFDAKLKLIGTSRISKNEIRLRYRVVKRGRY